MFENLPPPSFESMNLGVEKLTELDPLPILIMLICVALGLSLLYISIKNPRTNESLNI